VAAALRESPAFDAVVGVEVNISCPNVANRGLVFACDPLSSAKVIALVREKLPRNIPIFAKLSPDVTDIVEIARAGASAIQVGTATFNDPTAPVRVNRELAAALQDKGFARFSDAVGIAHTRLEQGR
jgi:dihydroorotate dehydrogenase